MFFCTPPPAYFLLSFLLVLTNAKNIPYAQCVKNADSLFGEWDFTLFFFSFEQMQLQQIKEHSLDLTATVVGTNRPPAVVTGLIYHSMTCFSIKSGGGEKEEEGKKKQLSLHWQNSHLLVSFSYTTAERWTGKRFILHTSWCHYVPHADIQNQVPLPSYTL